jgi:hypothetical protein
VLVGCFAEGTEDMTHTIAEAIDNGEDLRDCAKQLTAIADLLDALDAEDAGTMVELDMTEHAGALRDAIAAGLRLPAWKLLRQAEAILRRRRAKGRAKG